MDAQRALKDLLEQVESLRGYELTTDVPQDEAQAQFDYAVAQARKAVKGQA